MRFGSLFLAVLFGGGAALVVLIALDDPRGASHFLVLVSVVCLTVMAGLAAARPLYLVGSAIAGWGFVLVGAVLLAVAVVVILGGGRLLTPRNAFVMYFDGSVAGLQIGAPVNFRGVRIGSVSDIRVELDSRDATVRTPVFVEIEPRRISETGSAGGAPLQAPPLETMERLVERGLRAALAGAGPATT